MRSTFSGSDLALEVLEPGSQTLFRLNRHPGGDWEPPPPEYRTQRADPPDGHKDRYAVLYVADSLECVAMECRLLVEDAKGQWTWQRDKSAAYDLVRYSVHAPGVFVRLDSDDRKRLGLPSPGARFGEPNIYKDSQELCLEIYERFGKVTHGVTWQSFHRHQPGRVYAIWHDRKDQLGLVRDPAPPYRKLPDDPQWQEFLDTHNGIQAIS